MVKLKLKLEELDYSTWEQAFPHLRDHINEYRLRHRSELSPVQHLSNCAFSSARNARSAAAAMSSVAGSKE